MTIIFLTSADPGLWAHAAEQAPACAQWVLAMPAGEAWSCACRLGWVKASQQPVFFSISGISRVSSDRGPLYFYHFPKDSLKREISSKADEIWIADPAEAAQWRAFCHAKTRIRTTGSDSAVPAFLTGSPAEGFTLKGARSSPPEPAPGHIAVIGAGIAGSLLAYRLAEENCRVSVFDAAPVPGAGASALYCGLVHPHWQRSDNPLFRLTRCGFSLLVGLLEKFPACFHACGVADMATDDGEYDLWRQSVAAGEPFPMPEHFARLCSARELSSLTGADLAEGGWFYERAGLLAAGRFCRELIGKAAVPVYAAEPVSVRQGDDGWLVERAGDVMPFDAVVLCTAGETPAVMGVPQDSLGLSGLAGRISLLTRSPENLPSSVALTGRGYFAKLGEDFAAVGATYEHQEHPLSDKEALAHNLSLLQSLFPGLAVHRYATPAFYAGIRAVTRDRMPLVGAAFDLQRYREMQFRGKPELEKIPVRKGLWMCTAFGSRGLTWGLACVEELVSQILNRPSVLGKSLSKCLHPARFLDAPGL